MNLVFAFLIGLIVLTAAVGLQLHFRRIRKKRLSLLELRPNCLLTRHPIVFVNGRKSIFRLFDHWNDIPAYLREHGYEVFVIDPPSRGSCVRSLLNALNELPGRYHLIGDSSLEHDFHELAQSRHPKIATLTLARNIQTRGKDIKAGISVDALKPLPSNITTLDLQPIRNSGWMNRAAVFLLAAHNVLSFGQKLKVDAIETGHLFSGNTWDLEARFLDLAISLAERDSQWCD